MSAGEPPAPLERRRLGRYELITPLGRGGMATVYLARMHGTAGFHRLVAVKILRNELLDDPQLVTMFLDEARLAARIRHPNVVEVYDVETVDGELVIIMRWVEGASLSALERALPAEAPMPLALAMRIAHDALLGLHAAHELETETGQPAGLVHRDVSPPNILVAVDGTVLLTDFGIATAAGRLRSTGDDAIRGKLAYMAPEQLEGGALDRRTDVFAAGIVLWELIAGRRLFAAASADVVTRNVLETPISPPGAHRAGTPMAIDEVCLTALERDPTRRFPTAAAFAAALEEACGGAMMESRDVGKLVASSLAGAIDRTRAAIRQVPHEAAPDANEDMLTSALPTLVVIKPNKTAAAKATRARPRLLAASLLGGAVLMVGAAIALSRKPPPPIEEPAAPVVSVVVDPPASASEAPSAAPVASARTSSPRRPGSHRPIPRASAPTPPTKPTGAFVPTEP